MSDLFCKQLRLGCTIGQTRYALFLFFRLSLLRQLMGWLSAGHWSCHTSDMVSLVHYTRLTLLGLTIIMTTIRKLPC